MLTPEASDAIYDQMAQEVPSDPVQFIDYLIVKEDKFRELRLQIVILSDILVNQCRTQKTTPKDFWDAYRARRMHQRDQCPGPNQGLLKEYAAAKLRRKCQNPDPTGRDDLIYAHAVVCQNYADNQVRLLRDDIRELRDKHPLAITDEDRDDPTSRWAILTSLLPPVRLKRTTPVMIVASGDEASKKDGERPTEEVQEFTIPRKHTLPASESDASGESPVFVAVNDGSGDYFDPTGETKSPEPQETLPSEVSASSLDLNVPMDQAEVSSPTSAPDSDHATGSPTPSRPKKKLRRSDSTGPAYQHTLDRHGPVRESMLEEERSAAEKKALDRAAAKVTRELVKELDGLQAESKQAEASRVATEVAKINSWLAMGTEEAEWEPPQDLPPVSAGTVTTRPSQDTAPVDSSHPSSSRHTSEVSPLSRSLSHSAPRSVKTHREVTDLTGVDVKAATDALASIGELEMVLPAPNEPGVQYRLVMVREPAGLRNPVLAPPSADPGTASRDSATEDANPPPSGTITPVQSDITVGLQPKSSRPKMSEIPGTTVAEKLASLSRSRRAAVDKPAGQVPDTVAQKLPPVKGIPRGERKGK